MKNQGTLAEDVSAVLPILKPNQVKTVVSNAERFDWKAIQGWLPFMNEEDVKKFALQALEKGGRIEGFLPFMDEADVNELAVKALKGSLTK